MSNLADLHASINSDLITIEGLENILESGELTPGMEHLLSQTGMSIGDIEFSEEGIVSGIKNVVKKVTDKIQFVYNKYLAAIKGSESDFARKVKEAEASSDSGMLPVGKAKAFFGILIRLWAVYLIIAVFRRGGARASMDRDLNKIKNTYHSVKNVKGDYLIKQYRDITNKIRGNSKEVDKIPPGVSNKAIRKMSSVAEKIKNLSVESARGFGRHVDRNKWNYAIVGGHLAAYDYIDKVNKRMGHGPVGSYGKRFRQANRDMARDIKDSAKHTFNNVKHTFTRRK